MLSKRQKLKLKLLKLKGITLKWSKERRIRRDNFDATVKQFYVHAIKKLVLAKYVKRERSH